MVGRPLDETSIDETLLYLNITKVEPLESIFRLLWKAFKLIKEHTTIENVIEAL